MIVCNRTNQIAAKRSSREFANMRIWDVDQRKSVRNFYSSVFELRLTTVFVDTRLRKTKHPRKSFQNFRQFCPDALGKLCLFCEKNSVTSCLKQVCPVNIRSTKFCQSLPNFRDAVVLPRSRTNFCQAWNLTDLLICTPWFEGKCQSQKFDLYFSRSIEVRSPLKVYF